MKQVYKNNESLVSAEDGQICD